MKAKNMPLNSERLIIRPLEVKDAEAYSKLGCSYRSTGPIDNPKKAKQYIKKSLKSEDSFDVGIFLKDSNEMIGTIELCHMKWFNFKAGEICYTIHQDHWGKGFATEATKAFIDYCFKEMNFRKVYADTVPDNVGSQKVLEKLNFTLEGTIRERHFKDGKWIDELDYGLLRDEWEKEINTD